MVNIDFYDRNNNRKKVQKGHSVKSVRMQGFSIPYFGLNTERYGSKCRKICAIDSATATSDF